MDKDARSDSGCSLHPLATHPATAKRLKEIELDPERTEFARDRDRILYSRCFRRLAHKTQVYLTSAGGNQHLRTRMTHTLEVSQVARTIARSLRMNEDLTEAIALGHDVGHAPFGHVGERQLDEFLNERYQLPRQLAKQVRGGWEHRDYRHNYQSVRLLSLLEKYELDSNGLNLTLECLGGILKHTGIKRHGDPTATCLYPDSAGLFRKLIDVTPEHGHIESQIVAIADEVSQVSHDLGDALLAQVLDIEQLCECEALSTILESTGPKGCYVIQAISARHGSRPSLHEIMAHLTSAIITYFVRASISHAKEQLADIPTDLAKPVWKGCQPHPYDCFHQLRDFKDRLVVNSFPVNRMDNKGRYVIRRLIDAYISDPRQLPDGALARYTFVKGKELERLKAAGFQAWFRKIAEAHVLSRKLTADEIDMIITTVRVSPSHPPRIRHLPTELLAALNPYLVFDPDWLRTIVDHIATMTDPFAEVEMERLYGRGTS